MRHVNLFGPINQTGYGIHFTNFAAAMLALSAKQDFGMSVVPRGPLALPRGVPLSAAETAVVNAVRRPDTFQPHEPSIFLWHMNDVASYAGSTRYQYTVFETTKFRPLDVILAKKVDKVIVPTQWHVDQLLKEHGISALKIPEGVDPQVFPFGPVGLRNRYGSAEDPSDMTTFVSVGKLEKRKGNSILVDAVMQAAQRTGKMIRVLCHWINPFLVEMPYPDVLARVMASRGFEADPDWLLGKGDIDGVVRYRHKSLKNVLLDVITHPFRTHAQLVDVYRAGQFGIFPYYAEGWCLPLQESMACGLVPICQNYSGPSEYLRPGTFLEVAGKDAVAVDGIPVEGRVCNQFFYGDAGTWRQTDIESLAAAVMLALEMTPPEHEAMRRRSSVAALEYTWERAAKEAVQVLDAHQQQLRHEANDE